MRKDQLATNIIEWFEAMDSPKAKIFYLCFIFFALGYFLRAII